MISNSDIYTNKGMLVTVYLDNGKESDTPKSGKTVKSETLTAYKKNSYMDFFLCRKPMFCDVRLSCVVFPLGVTFLLERAGDF